MRWVADVKYASMGFLLTVMAPWPGRRRTRATACLRRPVVWVSGTGMVSFCRAEWSAGAASVGQFQRLGLLGGVRVIGAGVDVELAQHLAAKGVLGQHAPDGAADQL